MLRGLRVDGKGAGAALIHNLEPDFSGIHDTAHTRRDAGEDATAILGIYQTQCAEDTPQREVHRFLALTP